MSQKTHLPGETLAQFDALENVRTVRQVMASRDDLSVDSAGLLAVHTPLNEPAVAIDSALGPEKGSSIARPQIRAARSLFQRAQHWYQDPARIWVVGLTCVIAAGMLTFLILILTGSI